jgi:flagellar protein FliL
MSAAAADAGNAPEKKGSKKLIIIIAAVALLLVLGGGAAFFLLKKKSADEEEGEGGGGGGHAKVEAKHEAPKPKAKDPTAVPTFLPLESFTVNLADRDHERYAQVGITLEVDDPKFAEQMKGFMPAIRSGILLVLAHKTSEELLERDGKEKLAEEIMREAVRPMGIEIDPEDEESDSGAKKKKKKRAPVYNPVQRVLFSSFIIQ